jgi:hypothetical protein
MGGLTKSDRAQTRAQLSVAEAARAIRQPLQRQRFTSDFRSIGGVSARILCRIAARSRPADAPLAITRRSSCPNHGRCVAAKAYLSERHPGLFSLLVRASSSIFSWRIRRSSMPTRTACGSRSRISQGVPQSRPGSRPMIQALFEGRRLRHILTNRTARTMFKYALAVDGHVGPFFYKKPPSFML